MRLAGLCARAVLVSGMQTASTRRASAQLAALSYNVGGSCADAQGLVHIQLHELPGCIYADHSSLCCRCMKWRRMHLSTQAAHGFNQDTVSFYCELHPERPDLTCDLPEDL